MFIGNSYIIPAISNLPGQHPRVEPGFAFEFKKNEDSWFEADNASVANYKGLAISCWIKLPDSFFVDFDPDPNLPIAPTETQHILDKYGFSGGIASGYRLILEKGQNASRSTFRRLVWQIAFGDGNQIRTFVNINSLSANTVYLVTASAYEQGKPAKTRLFIKGANNVLLTADNTISEVIGQAAVPLVLGNANPTSTALEYDGDLDEVAIWNNTAMNEAITNEIFNWIGKSDLNNLQNIGPPNYWWQMGENASIVVVNNQDEYELPNQGSEGSNIVLTGTGTINNRISPGLPNQLYNPAFIL